MYKVLKHFPFPTEASTSDVVILANGDFPTHRIPLTILQRAKCVICCDGAANEYIRRGYVPKFIIGDCDSLAPEFRSEYAGITCYSSDQETNDLTKAVVYCISQRLTNIIIVGATGKREDHTIGNVSLLIDYIDLVDSVQIITDHGVFTATDSDSTFECEVGGAVSIFSFKMAPVRGRGLKYPLRAFTNWWQGTLNTATANPFTLLVREKVLVFRGF